MATDLIGRRSELEVAERFLDELAGGSVPRSLEIGGEAGIGKTAFLEAIVDAARTRGHRVLAVQAAEAEADLAFAGLDALLASVQASAFATLAPPLRRAIEVALLRVDPGAAGVDFRAVGVALAAILDGLSRDGPVVLAIDDRQWLDGPTARVVDIATRRLAARPVGLVETRRLAIGDVDRGFREADGRRIRLSGLSLAGLRTLVEERTGIALARSSLTRLESLSGGNPLLALEVVDYLRRRGREVRVDELAPVPVDVQRLVGDRMAALGPDARAVLEIAALMGRPDLDRLRRLVGPSDIEEAVREAVDAGLIRLEGARIAFAHPAFASAVHGGLSEARRLELHRRLAAELPDPVESARHLALATTVPDAAVAGLLASAARLSAGRGAPDFAVVLLEEARRLTPSAEQASRDARTFELSRALWELGEVERSEALAAELEGGLPAGPPRAMVRLLRASHLGWTLGPAASIAMSELALEDAGGDPIVTAQVRLRLAYEMDADLPAAAAHVAAAEEAVAGRDDPLAHELAVAATLYGHDIRLRRGLPVSRAELDAGRARLRALPETDDAALEVHPRGMAREREWLILERLDDLVRARDGLASLLREDEAVGRDRPMVIAHSDLAELESWLGNAEAARAHADAATELAAQTGRTAHAMAMVGVGRGQVALLEGDAVGAIEAVDRGLASTLPSGAEVVDRLRAIRGSALLTLGRHDAAIVEFEAVAAALDAAGLRHPSMYRFRGDHIEALVLAGAAHRARTETDRLDRGGADLGSAWIDVIVARSRAWLAAADGDPDGSIDWLDRALERHPELPMPLELGRTQLLLGQVRRRRKEKRLADEALRAALATFERAGAHGWEARTRAELERVGLRPRAPATLTPTEAEVARLAASGLTNRQVADAVVLSPKTIDGVLSRVYAKLGIRSRAELGARMATIETEDTAH